MKIMIINSIEDFFLKTPLYEKLSIEESYSNTIFDIVYFNKKIDCYCTSCKKESTFVGKNPVPMLGRYPTHSYEEMLKTGNGFEFFKNKIYHLEFYCTRNEKHKMHQSLIITENELFKIGQHPSIADISIPELKKYRKVLSPEKYSEFIRGNGLITHGIGIGSFVYLRRIFEYLIEEAHIKLKNEKGWNEEEYINSRISDKIQILRTELPDFLVKNKSIYSILSIGIHELSENECLKYFPSVKLGIELILDEKLEKKQKEDKINLATKNIMKIVNEIK